MTVEEQLKLIIEEKYKNVRNFSMSVGIPYSTMRSVLERGLNKANISTVLTICDALGIEAESIATGKIEFIKPKITDDFLVAFSEIGDYQDLDDQQKEMIRTMIKTFKDQNSKK